MKYNVKNEKMRLKTVKNITVASQTMRLEKQPSYVLPIKLLDLNRIYHLKLR